MTPQLEDLLATHADVLQPLLGPLWPVCPFKTEQFGLLTKYTLGQMPNGTWAMLHCITGSDAVAHPHDHPCRFDSYGIKGSYWENSYYEDGRTELTLRAPGGHYTIWPHTIHEVVATMDGPVWTLVFAHEVVQQARHYPELVA
jgi:hypothetical protein